MTALPELHPVAEAPWFETTPPWPWPIADHKRFSYFRLSREMTGPEIGSVMAQLVGNDPSDVEPTVAGLLSRTVDDERWILSGGIQASAGERVIDPSCCCGLESWREWLAFRDSGSSPWLGHGPTPYLERAEGAVRIWSWAQGTPDDPPFAIEFERERFAAELARVERELRGFLSRIPDWARAAGVADPQLLCRKVDESFQITAAEGAA